MELPGIVANLRNRRILREGATIALGSLLTIVARLVGLRLITALVSPSIYGEFVLLIGAEVLVQGVCCAPVLQAALRFYPDAVREGRASALRALLRRMLGRGLALAVVLLLVGGAIWERLADTDVAFLVFPLLGVLLLFEVQRSLEISVLNAARRQTAYTVWMTADAWARPLGAVVCILALGPRTSSILIGYAAGTLIVNLSCARAITRPGVRDGGPVVDPSWSARVAPEILRFALPIAPMGVLNWFANLGDRYILAGATSSEETGIYSAAYGLASQPFIVLAGIAAQTLRPVLFDAFSSGDGKKVGRVLFAWLASLAAIFAGGLLLLWLLSDQIVRLILAEAFWEASPLLVWIGVAYSVQGVQQAFASLIYAQRRTDLLVIMRVVTALSAAALYFLLIPPFGALGAAWGTLGANLVSLVVTALLAGVGRPSGAGRTASRIG